MTVDSFNLFIQKWVTPATVVIVFGAIVWGVQLNIVSLQHAKAIAANHTAIESLAEKVISDEFDLQRTALLLEQTSANLAELKRATEQHASEAEKWKRQIIRNQDSIQRLEKQ